MEVTQSADNGLSTFISAKKETSHARQESEKQKAWVKKKSNKTINMEKIYKIIRPLFPLWGWSNFLMAYEHCKKMYGLFLFNTY